MSNLSSIGRLANLTEGQHGYATEVQATNLGLPELEIAELKREAVIEDVVPGVLRLRGGPRHRFPRFYAAWLLTDPGIPAWERPLVHSGAFSYGSATKLYGVGDFPGPDIDFTIPSSAHKGPDYIYFHVEELELHDLNHIEGLPVTTPARTIKDLAKSSRLDLLELGRIVASFIRNKWCTKKELGDKLAISSKETEYGEWLEVLLETAEASPESR